MGRYGTERCGNCQRNAGALSEMRWRPVRHSAVPRDFSVPVRERDPAPRTVTIEAADDALIAD